MIASPRSFPPSHRGSDEVFGSKTSRRDDKLSVRSEAPRLVLGSGANTFERRRKWISEFRRPEPNRGDFQILPEQFPERRIDFRKWNGSMRWVRNRFVLKVEREFQKNVPNSERQLSSVREQAPGLRSWPFLPRVGGRCGSGSPRLWPRRLANRDLKNHLPPLADSNCLKKINLKKKVDETKNYKLAGYWVKNELNTVFTCKAFKNNNNCWTSWWVSEFYWKAFDYKKCNKPNGCFHITDPGFFKLQPVCMLGIVL